MSLYAIGDLHLHFQSELKAASQLKDRVWKKHEEKFRKNCEKMVGEEDTLVLIGDHSWGRDLSECEQDLQYIKDLPGRKILSRGNHDMFWDAKKTKQLNERFNPELFFLQDNYYAYQDYALVGTKGFTFEGPFYLDCRGRIIGWDEEKEEHAKKLVSRELQRLRTSFEAAVLDGYRKFIMFLHYPPTNILEECSGFTDMAKEYGTEQVIYAHSHGESRFHDSIQGEFDGIRYRLASGDYLKWIPIKVVEQDLKGDMDIAEEIGALVAPGGENWWNNKKSWQELKMYDPDGEHASEQGSDFAAKHLWETIRVYLARKERISESVR